MQVREKGNISTKRGRELKIEKLLNVIREGKRQKQEIDKIEAKIPENTRTPKHTHPHTDT